MQLNFSMCVKIGQDVPESVSELFFFEEVDVEHKSDLGDDDLVCGHRSSPVRPGWYPELACRVDVPRPVDRIHHCRCSSPGEA